MKMTNELLNNVYRHPLLTIEDLGKLTSVHKRELFAKGDFLIKESQIANEYCILESGLIRSFVHDFDNKDITTNFFTTNDIVIEVSSLFQRIPSQENIQALTDCVCWKIDFEDFQKLFHTLEGFSEWGRAWMSQSLFEFKRRSVSMITSSATDRYNELLKNNPDVLKYAPLKHVATYLGITDTSLSRIRKEMAGH